MNPPQRLVFRRTGKPAEVLELEQFHPQPQPGELLIRLQAAPINPADLNFIEGTYGIKPTLPAIPGLEGCGIVESTDHPEFPAGTPVAFLGQAAAWASHTCAPPQRLIRLPQGIDPLQAAMLKVNPATAWALLHRFARLNPGDWIVQNAATSGVGRCVIQLARDAGLRTLSLVRRPDTAADLPSLGADHVLPDSEEGLAAALEILGGRHAALALNAVGGESALRLMNLIRDEAPHVTYGAMARRPLTVPNGLLIFRNLSLHGFWLTRWIEATPPAEVHAVYQDLATRIAAGTLLQRVDSTFPLHQFPTAFARLDDPLRNGKVLYRCTIE